MMHFQFDAYTPEELILASNFLLELAKLQQKRREQQPPDPVYPFEGNLSQPINSVQAGMPGMSYPGYRDAV